MKQANAQQHASSYEYKQEQRQQRKQSYFMRKARQGKRSQWQQVELA